MDIIFADFKIVFSFVILIMSHIYHKLFILFVLIVTGVASANGQAKRRNQFYAEYISKYSDMAVRQMKEHKIPASITLAQALLESGAGKSELARKSNNHFGIKCGRVWSGQTVRHDDDARNECFRAYRHVKDSYEDHSSFLKSGAHYAPLFRLKITDYKEWAHGLKKAGYATDPAYAARLIAIIEDYELYKYDGKGGSKRKTAPTGFSHRVYLSNDAAYVKADEGDTFKSIGKEFDISERKLIKHNDLYKGYKLVKGDIVYLREKKKKAAKPYTVHEIKFGDSMHGVSQRYGIRLKNLYKMNRKTPDYIPQPGDRLKLR